MASRNLLVIPQEGDHHVVPESTIGQEYDLQEAFKHHPELIPVSDLGLGTLLVVGRETTVESGGAVDLLAVDSKGRVVIAEFKRGPQNPDSRRVIAQVLEYASCLWGESYEDFDDLVVQRYLTTQRCTDPRTKGKQSLEEAAAACWGGESEFSIDDFRQGISDSLADGALHCVIISTEMDDTTRRTIDFLNATARFRCYGIEVDHFSDQERRIFVPRVAVVPPDGERRHRGVAGPKTTRENFLASCDEASRPFFTELLDHMESTDQVLYWGTKGFSYRLRVHDAVRTVFYGYPRGTMGLDHDFAEIVVSELPKSGVPQPIVQEYAAVAAGLSVLYTNPSGNRGFSVDEKADSGAIISALTRLLKSVRDLMQPNP
jgi:hypothetical protein